MWIILTFLVVCILITALRFQIFVFKNQKISRFKDQKNYFDVRDCLNGQMLAEGIIYGITGKLESTFVANFEGSWAGDQGVLTEHFHFSSGKEQVRNWSLTVLEDGTIEGTAPDIIGKASGQQLGSAVRLKYRLKLSQDLGGHAIDVIDWMHLMENGTIMNRSEFRKFGIKVGELVATFRKINEDA